MTTRKDLLVTTQAILFFGLATDVKIKIAERANRICTGNSQAHYSRTLGC